MGVESTYPLVQPVVLVLVASALVQHCHAQTEGDTGYDYMDAYDDDFDDDSVLGLEPTFDVPLVNVTVVAGQTAVLPCSIDYLGKYKVSWVDHHYIPLSYEDRRVVDDHRFSIVRPFIKEWNLQIRDVTWEDQGQYRCTVNTVPVKSKIVMLHVKVPAQIIDELSSDDVTVQEGDTIILICNVTGVPRPDVTWYRRPAMAKATEKESKMCKRMMRFGPGIGLKGEMIIIQNVSRYCDDIYECVADNGVPPAVSRQMRVTVEFAPEIRMPNNRIGQLRNKDTILECIITAFPHAVNYWEKDGKRIMSSTKHRIEAYDEGDHTITLSLRIHDIEHEDYGEYKCVAANALGRDEEAMWLYEYSEPEPRISTPPEWPVIIPISTTPSHAQKVDITPEGHSWAKKPGKNGHHNNIDDKGHNGPPASGRVTGGGASKQSLSLSAALLASLSLLAITTLTHLHHIV